MLFNTENSIPFLVSSLVFLLVWGSFHIALILALIVCLLVFAAVKFIIGKTTVKNINE